MRSCSNKSRASTGARGFTLMESLIATGILMMVVIAVTAALTAANQQSYDAQQRIAAGLAAEELMSRLLVVEYDDLAAWDGYTEPVGAMTNVAGKPLPETFSGIGRRVSITTSLRVATNLNVRVRGRTITVVAFDQGDNELATLTRFVPEPQS